MAEVICKNGHKMTEDNTYTDTKGYKHCRICTRKYRAEYAKKYFSRPNPLRIENYKGRKKR